MKFCLFQFWDTENAPIYIEELMKSWSIDNSFEYYRFDSVLAKDFILNNFDVRAYEAFSVCAVPAMQADFFRLCALYHFGGMYVDADTQNMGGVMQLTKRGERGYLFLRGGKRVANDFMFVRHSKDPLIAYALGVAINNIERRVSNNVWEVTGPGILTRLYSANTAEKSRLFDGFYIDDVVNTRRLVGFKADLPYKNTDKHWLDNNEIFK